MALNTRGQTLISTRADSLVVLAYRCWHAGFDYSDAECWQYAWSVLSSELAVPHARNVLSGIEDLVRTIRSVSTRPIVYYPPPCCRASAGEQAMLELVAALQAGRNEVGEWLESLCGEPGLSDADRVVSCANALAGSLLDAGLVILAGRPPATTLRPLRELN